MSRTQRFPPLAIALAIVIAGCAAVPGRISGTDGRAGGPAPESHAPAPTATGARSTATTAARTAAPTTAAVPARTAAPARTAVPTTSPAPTTAAISLSTTARPTIAQLIGQKLVVRMDGTTPSADLLGRIRRGEVGGVILFGRNITTAYALRTLTAKLRAAATAGGRPKLLIAVDQEGGSVKRIPWAPPTLTPWQMGTLGLAAVAHTQGQMTGGALRGLGINVDFAPVADVPVSTSSFMYQEGRTWSFSAIRTSGVANAFATGLESAHVVPVMKHFPGIGFATRNTDSWVVTIGASRAALAPGLIPYRHAIAQGIPMIMLSNATYTAYDRSHAAGWSPAIGTLLRHDLGFTGVTISDGLDGTAKARGVTPSQLAIAAALAGTDMILTTGSESSTRLVYAALVREATAARIPRATLLASYNRILLLKARL
jgi:beta-N-acetylhexosaminidase